MAGLALQLLRMAIAHLGNTKEANDVASAVAKLGRTFPPPPADLGQAELKFMGSQLGAQGPPAGGAAPGGMPPRPPMPPGAAPAAPTPEPAAQAA